MAHVGGVAVAKDVGSPLVLSGVGVTGTDIAGLESLEILQGAQLVGHFEGFFGVYLIEEVKRSCEDWSRDGSYVT